MLIKINPSRAHTHIPACARRGGVRSLSSLSLPLSLPLLLCLFSRLPNLAAAELTLAGSTGVPSRGLLMSGAISMGETRKHLFRRSSEGETPRVGFREHEHDSGFMKPC
eukprot:scaffold264368_cov32-Tisochrysis_lutea.AAC.2